MDISKAPTEVNGSVSHPNDPIDTDASNQLRQRLEARTATIGVIGMGYVGLPLAVEYAREGFETIGIDLNEQRINRLNAGDNYIDDLDDEEVQALVEDDLLRGTTTFEDSPDIDIFFVCVPTPVTVNKEPDTSYIQSASASIAEHIRPGQLVVLKSTTYPNTTEGVVLPILEASAEDQGLTLGEDFFLAFSPERIDPGNKEFNTSNTPVVVGGVTPGCTTMAELALTQIIAEVHVVSNPKVAEMEKLLENIFRSVNIALVNELARLCDRVGDVSMWEVVEAAATKPFGFMPFYPGPGLGGHCIPVDPYYLSWSARKHDFETSFITLSARINESMPFYVAESVVEAIAHEPVRLQDARVLIVGVAFKGNVDDTRHSPAETIVKLLRDKGVRHIEYHDPHVPQYTVTDSNGDIIDLPAVDLTPETLEACDVALIVTNHEAVDGTLIARHAPRIVDTRNALADVDVEGLSDKLTLLGGG